MLDTSPSIRSMPVGVVCAAMVTTWSRTTEATRGSWATRAAAWSDIRAA